MENLTFLETELGPIHEIEQICPDVCYISTGSGECFAVSKDGPTISRCAKAYGKSLPDHPATLLYFMDKPDSGWMIIRYELCKYLMKNLHPLPEDLTLRTAAIFGAECHPEYFGAIPVPPLTPQGRTLRYTNLDNGIYWIETEQCTEMLAVCFPIWDAELSEAAQKLGIPVGDNTGCLFFPETASCVPIFELMQTHRAWERFIDVNALMNAIWEGVPDYVLAYNGWEQVGLNDLPGILLNSLGAEAELIGRPDRTIRITPRAGTAFLKKDVLFDG